MRHRLRARTHLGRLLWLGATLLGAAGTRAWAQCPMPEQVTWPVDGATLPPGHIQVRVTRGSNVAPYFWSTVAPDATVKQDFDCFCTVATDDIHMTPLGNNQFIWDFDAAGFAAGVYEIDILDPIWEHDGMGGIVSSYVCPPIAPNSYNTQIHFTIGGTPTERTFSAQSIGQMCMQDAVTTQSATSPLTGSQSWSVPVTSWDFHGTTFGLTLSYNSVSHADPETYDPTSPTPQDPLIPDYAGLSERNSKWSQPYAQWIEVVHDETGAEHAIWHHGGGELPFQKSGTTFTSPDSYHTLAYGGSAPGSYLCSGLNVNVTVPYGWFTITDGAGTQYFFNQPQPGTGTHLAWITGDCFTIPQYLLSRIQDRWGRGVNMTWSDVTVGSGTQKRVTAVKDDSGAGLTMTYANGLLQMVTDPQGRTHTLGYTAVADETLPTPVNRMKLSSITVQGPGSPNRTSRTWRFVYSSDPATNTAAYGGTYTGDLVIQKTEPDGTSASYQYEPIFLDPADHTRPRQEDWDGRVTAVSWPDASEGGQSVTYTITRTLNSPTQATLTYPSSPGLPLQVQYNYDSSSNLTSVTDLATGRVWSYTYDGQRNLLTVRSPLEQTGNPLVQYTYTTDGSGHITQRVAQVLQTGGTLGDPVTTTFNLLNEPTQITASARAGDGNVDQVTQLHYDNDAPIVVPGSPGNLTKILSAYGTSLQQETDLTYGGTPGPWGLPDSVKNAVGAVSTFGYDSPSGRLLTAASPLNLLVPMTNADHAASVTTLQYNGDGLPSLVQDPMGHQEMITYTAQSAGSGNLVITVTHVADSSTRTITLDPMGRILQAVDENGVKTVWTYNPRGQVKTITRAVGLPEQTVTTFNYDCRGDLYRIAPPSGGAGRTLFVYLRYKQDGTLDKTQSPNGTYEGQVCRISYADGTNEYFGYNQAGELAWRRKPDGTIVTIATRDALHRITQISYPASQGNAAFNVSTVFDEFGRVTSTADSTGTTAAVYDALNRIVSLTPPSAQKALTYSYVPDTTNQRWSTTVTLAGVGNYVYQEDTKGRLASLVNPFNRTFSMGYDPDGKNLLVTFPNGVQESRTYTTRDWLASVQITKANLMTADTFSYLYTNASSLYDPTGHLQREVDAGNRTHAFIYDHLYELVQEQHPDFGTISYGYDLNGNRTSKNTNGVIDYYGVDAANKLLWVNQGTNAMPTSGQANPYTLFSYDPNGNMSHRERKYGAPYAGVTRVYDFYWDGDDRLRTAKQSGVTSFSANYNGDGVRVYKSDTWTSAHNYTWGPGGVLFDSNNSSTYTPGLAQNQGGSDRYLHSDWIGSTRYLSDSTGNNFPGMLRYDAFGGRSATSGTDGYYPTASEFAGGFGYHTEYASTSEPGVGLQYLGQRYYDPAFGRFITPDPIGSAGGLNMYTYAADNPVNAVDPSGLVLTPLDGLVLGYDTFHLGYSVYNGDWRGAAADTGLLAFDSLLTLIPGVPPAAGAGRAALALAEIGARPAERVAGELALGALVRGVHYASSSGDRGCSTTLGENLESAGVERPEDTAAHHIVAGGAERAQAARDILKKWGIGINDAVNGVFLPRIRGAVAPGAYHPSLHTGTYYAGVEDLLRTAGSKEEAEIILRRIAQDLLDNNFPH